MILHVCAIRLHVQNNTYSYIHTCSSSFSRFNTKCAKHGSPGTSQARSDKHTYLHAPTHTHTHLHADSHTEADSKRRLHESCAMVKDITSTFLQELMGMGFTRVYIKKDDASMLAAAENACSMVRQCGVQLPCYESISNLTTDGRRREAGACAVGFYIYMSTCHPGMYMHANAYGIFVHIYDMCTS
jgi:hypothetical protein